MPERADLWRATRAADQWLLSSDDSSSMTVKFWPTVFMSGRFGD